MTLGVAMPTPAETYPSGLLAVEYHQGSHLMRILTLAYVASVPFDILPVSFGRSITTPIGLVLVGLWGVSRLRRRSKFRFPASVTLILVMYLGWAATTITWSADPALSILTLQSLIVRALLLVVLCNTLPPIRDQVLAILGCSTAVLGLIILTQPADALRDGRSNVGGIDENVTALVLSIGFAAIICLLTFYRDKHHVLWLIPVGVVALATLHTGSRTGMIAIVMTTAVAIGRLLFRRPIRVSAVLRTAAIIVFLISCVHFAAQAGLVPDRVSEVFGNSDRLGDSQRGVIIDSYRATQSDWELFGVGIGSDAPYLRQSQSLYLNAHGTLWKVWIETGIVGLILFGALLVVIARRSRWSVARQALPILAVPIVVFAITLGGERTSAVWLIAALALTQRPAALRSIPSSIYYGPNRSHVSQQWLALSTAPTRVHRDM